MHRLALLLLLSTLACLSPGTPEKALQRWHKQEPTEYFYLRQETQPRLGIARITGVSVRNTTVDRVWSKALSRNPAGQMVILGTAFERLPGRTTDQIRPDQKRSMPELLEDCALQRSQADQGSRTRFKAGGKGQLLFCHVVRRDCQDDCPRAVEVIEFQTRHLSDDEIARYLQHTRTLVGTGK